MDLFDIVISPHALEQLEDYVDYIQYTLFNPIAAKSVWNDAISTQEELEKCAGSLQYCRNPDLRELGYRPISFFKHDYVMLYRVEGKTAYVEAIYHLSQDYEKRFLHDRIK